MTRAIRLFAALVVLTTVLVQLLLIVNPSQKALLRSICLVIVVLGMNWIAELLSKQNNRSNK